MSDLNKSSSLCSVSFFALHLLLLLLFSTTVSVQTITRELQWQRCSNYSDTLGRHHPITFANETHGFLLTGSTPQSVVSSEFYIYRETNNEWIPVEKRIDPDFESRSFGYGIVLPIANHTKAYLGFGAASNGTRLNDLWEFDMQTYAWKRLADLPGPGRRHPSMVPVLMNDGHSHWKIHVGLGDTLMDGSQFSNLNDYWSYDIATDSWEPLADFPGTPRHHPFYFGIGSISYTGLGHSDGRDPYIERDFYSYHMETQEWIRETDFQSYQIDSDSLTTGMVDSQPPPSLVSTEARVAGTQFSIELPLPGNTDTIAINHELSGSLGFVVSGDGDDHGAMETGEFHAFYPANSPLITWNTNINTATSRQTPSDSFNNGSWWRRLPPHPGKSRWAPGSFVMRGTARAYFTSGYDRSDGQLYADLWAIDLSPLFRSFDSGADSTELEEDGTSASAEDEGEDTTEDTEDSNMTASSSSAETGNANSVNSGAFRFGILATYLSVVFAAIITNFIISDRYYLI